MKFKNYEITNLSNFLFNLNLSGKKSRMRTRFISLLNNQLELVELERKQLLDEYAMRDENGEILLNESHTEVILIPDKVMEFNDEYNELLNEDFIIEVTEMNREMILTVGETLLNLDVELSGQDAELYDYWCLKFEEVLEDSTEFLGG